MVDALLGTGLQGPATGPVAAAIVAINAVAWPAAGAAGRPVCALDLPSGLASDGEAEPGPTVRATLTLAIGLPKLALYLPHGGPMPATSSGWTWASPRPGSPPGPARARPSSRPPMSGPPSRRGRSIPTRDSTATFVVAGSRGKSGAALLACRAALRAGAGLVTVALPASQQAHLAAALAEAMSEALPELPGGSLAPDGLDRVLGLAATRDALALGPGLGLDPGTQALVRELVARVEQPMVVDADALTALAGHLDRVRRPGGPGSSRRTPGRRPASWPPPR